MGRTCDLHTDGEKREERQFRWAEALLQVVVSGFAGMLTMLLSWYIAAPPVVRLHGWPGWLDGVESTGAVRTPGNRLDGREE